MTRKRFMKQNLLVYNIANSNSSPTTMTTTTTTNTEASSNGIHNVSPIIHDTSNNTSTTQNTSNDVTKIVQPKPRRGLRNLDLNVLRSNNTKNLTNANNKEFGEKTNHNHGKIPKKGSIHISMEKEKKKSKPWILSKLKHKGKNHKNNKSNDDKENNNNNSNSSKQILSSTFTRTNSHKNNHNNVIHKDNNNNENENELNKKKQQSNSQKQLQQHDPLAKIIEARNTQKVRFDLTRNKIHNIPSITTRSVSLSTPFSSLLSPSSSSLSSLPSPSSSSSSSSPSSPLFSYSENSLSSSIPNVKGFMKRVLFGANSDTDTVSSSNNDPATDNGIGTASDNGTTSDTSSSSPLASILSKSSTTSFKDNQKKNKSLQDSSSKSNSNNNSSSSNNNNSDVTSTTNTNITTSSSDTTTTKISSEIDELIRKGKKAQYTKYQYHRASNYYLQALSKLDQNKHDPNYPKQHSITLHLLNDTHHAMRTLEHSADIVKMGLKHEEKQEYMKALKMYTVAFRMRRDAMGKLHPTLPILLNMLGSVQMKRGELDEAMQIFELAIYGRLKNDDMKVVGRMNLSHVTRAVSMREMGKIYECKGDDDNALEMYHNSLECVMERKKQYQNQNQQQKMKNGIYHHHIDSSSSSPNVKEEISQCDIRLMNADHHDGTSTYSSDDDSLSKQYDTGESEEMEVFLENKSFIGERCASNLCAFYNLFFQDDEIIISKNVSVHIAMTLHHVANIHSKRRHYILALSTYEAALRGMKIAIGAKHPNVAAVLGNIGNLYKEMKKFDLAYDIYQDVLEIEHRNLGFTHPEVIVTMHNIAMIEKCRGNLKSSKRLYRKVLSIQLGREERSIRWYNSTALSYSCLGDVEERDGDYKAAIEAYKQALSTRTIYIDKFHPDLGRLLHKIGALNATNGNFRDAIIYFAKALRLYEINNIEDSRVMVVKRDQADVLGKIALNTSTI